MPYPSKIVGDVARPAGLHPVLLERHGAFAGSRLVHGDHDVVLGAAVRVQPGVELAPVTGTPSRRPAGSSNFTKRFSLVTLARFVRTCADEFGSRCPSYLRR
jgi:hypothetical protein